MAARLYIGNLPYACSDDDVRELFQAAGVEPTSVRVIMDRSTGLSKGFGFVEVETHDQAVRSRNALAGASIGNRNLVVDLAKPNPTGRR